MTTVRDLYTHYVQYENSHMAHLLHHLMKEGHIRQGDDCNKIDYSLVDEAKVNEMVEQNYLCFNPIKIFSLKVDDYLFAFVFAKNEAEAIEFTKGLKHKPRNCHEYMLDIEMERDGGKVLTFRDMKKEHETFPALAGYFETDPVYRKG